MIAKGPALAVPLRARVVDTSALVAAASGDDAHHAAAIRLFADAGPAVVPNEVLVETLGLLGKRVGRAAAARFLEALRATDGIELGHDSDLSAALELRDKQPSLSLVDAVGVTLAWRLGCDLDTFDANQRKAWSAHRGSRRLARNP